jgi:GT2 family glycosyltransferase
MLVRADAIRAVGGVPSEHFMFAEDLRLCRNLRGAGHCIKYVPQASLIHFHGGTSDATDISTRWIRSTLTEFASASNLAATQLMKLIFAGGFFMRTLAYAACAVVTRRSDYRRRTNMMWAYFKASLAAPNAS